MSQHVGRERGKVDSILKALRARGAYAEKIHGSGQQSRMHDIVACYRGFFLSLEVKRSEKEELTPFQDHIIGAVKAAGGTAEKIVSTDDIKRILDDIDTRLLFGDGR